ncbi:MAG TPA: alpha/beta fold hydrolase [Caulobacteraceae bacterium]|nr:alpha/beta fold hydrolase [Caulobacteraceae bacterium]
MALAFPAAAAVHPFPPGFQARDIDVGDQVHIHTLVGGHGPGVLMIHGFGDTGDTWAPLAAVLARDHTVIVPDLRGFGGSTLTDRGLDKKTQADDMERVLNTFGVIANSGHWLMEEQPDATIAAITAFLQPSR